MTDLAMGKLCLEAQFIRLQVHVSQWNVRISFSRQWISIGKQMAVTAENFPAVRRRNRKICNFDLAR